MPAKEIKELRQSGKLEEALTMAKSELEVQPDNIWAKRNISWVYYDYLKQNVASVDVDGFISILSEIKNLELPVDEKMLFDNLSWQIGSMVFKILGSDNLQLAKLKLMIEISMSFEYTKPSEGYSFLFKAFHKALKIDNTYIQFADWWNFENFREVDYQKETLPNGREIMSIVEQAYITYAKHLLPIQHPDGEIVFHKEKSLAFIEKLSVLEEKHKEYQYPAYFKAKLLLAVGDQDNMLESLIPFAKKKCNDFWVWEILAEAFSSEPEKVFACYCKALSCKSPEEMLVGIRQKMARILISKNNYNEAKTEIELLVKVRNQHAFKIPNEVLKFQSQEWFKNASVHISNTDFYKRYIPEAESLLYYDIPEEMLIVEFVNTDKKILNFIASESKFGFLKYDRFFRQVKIGETLKVRFQGGSNEGMHQLYTASKIEDTSFKKQFLKEVEGKVRIQSGKPFGFLEDVFIHPSLVTKLRLQDGMIFKGNAMKSYNKDKKMWSWKMIDK
ncbi:DUF7017 domain-containing protein [Flavobacterium sp. GNP001]